MSSQLNIQYLKVSKSPGEAAREMWGECTRFGCSAYFRKWAPALCVYIPHRRTRTHTLTQSNYRVSANDAQGCYQVPTLVHYHYPVSLLPTSNHCIRHLRFQSWVFTALCRASSNLNVELDTSCASLVLSSGVMILARASVCCVGCILTPLVAR